MGIVPSAVLHLQMASVGETVGQPTQAAVTLPKPAHMSMGGRYFLPEPQPKACCYTQRLLTQRHLTGDAHEERAMWQSWLPEPMGPWEGV